MCFLMVFICLGFCSSNKGRYLGPITEALGLALAMFWSITSSIALPMETIGVTLVASDLYGNKAFDQILGIMLALNHLGYAVGSLAMNGLYDLCGGTYFYAMLLGAGLLLFVTIMYQFIITAAHKVRKQVESEV